jgi:hypothetical protein
MRLRISALFLSVALSTVAASAQSNQTLTGNGAFSRVTDESARAPSH